jgi:ATP-dependent DNA helicase RecG
MVKPVGSVLVVTLREAESKPVQCREGFFWRQGAVTQKLSRDEIRDFFRSEGVIRFDLAPCAKFRYPGDFDRDRFEAWRQKSRIAKSAAVEDVLVNIEAAERSGDRFVMRNGGALFFARNVKHFFPQAYITCLLARGTDKVHVLDRKDFAGGIVADIDDAMVFIERNTRTGWRIRGLQREDVPEYPTDGIREAITNAVMHRDWWEVGANVFVEIYSDRIEVSNPGGLPPGLPPEKLGTRSVRRNPLIADLLHRINYIEKAGTGIKRMREAAREHGSPEPEFESAGFFNATFRPLADTSDASFVVDRSRPTTGSATQPATQSTTQSSDPVERLLLLLVAGDQAPEALRQSLGIKHRPTFRKNYVHPAMQEGWIEFTIPDRPNSRLQRYRLTDAGRVWLATPGGRDKMLAVARRLATPEQRKALPDPVDRQVGRHRGRRTS